MRAFGLTGKAVPARVLCLGAHADDIEIGCGATILELLAHHSIEIVWVVFSGDARREQEARKSAKLFLAGAARSQVIVHQLRDGFFPYGGGEAKELFEELKSHISPDLVFTHYRDDRHQDHRVISDLTWNTFRDHLILEYEIAKYDADLGSPNLFVPIGQTAAKKKLRFLRAAFASQHDRHWFTNDAFLALMRLRGLECRAPGGYAEAFHSRKAIVDIAQSNGAGRSAARGAKRRGR